MTQHVIDGRHEREAGLTFPELRPEERQQGREQCHGAQEGNQHPEACNQTQLGNADEARRGKGQEARSGCKRGDQNLCATLLSSENEGIMQRGHRAIFVALSPEADAVLNGKIHSNAHEQDRERHRDEIEFLHAKRSKAGRQQKACNQSQQNGNNDADGMHGQNQPECDQNQRNDQTEHHAMGNGRELFVVELDLASNAAGGLTGLYEFKAVNRLAHCRRGALSGLKGAIIQLRLCDDEFVAAAKLGQTTDKKILPGQILRLTSRGLGQRVRKAVQSVVEAAGNALPGLDTVPNQAKGTE